MLLDHGAHVVLPEHLRRSYCQLWAAFVTSDDKGATQVGQLGLSGGSVASDQATRYCQVEPG